MRKIQRRSLFCLLLAALLFIGLSIYAFRFAKNGGKWVSYPYNRHIFNAAGQLKSGTILDRNEVILSQPADSEQGRLYHEDATVRKATLHAVGDLAGNIGAGAQTAFADRLAGYNPITGVYSTIGEGSRVYLTIDAELNRVAYEALAGRRGTVGLYNYKTGDILCMVSSPTFDPQYPPDIEPDAPEWEGVYVNRLLLASTTPGSIFKAVTLTAAIENIPDLYERRWTCVGRTEIGGGDITCPVQHGEQGIQDALANSCNCVFGQLAVELGSEKMASYTAKAGLDAPIEVSGIKTAAGRFDFAVDENQLAWAGIGQGQDEVCPASMMQFMGAVANGGTAAVPRLLERSTNSLGLPTSLVLPRESGTLIETSTAAALADMMQYTAVYNYGQDRFPNLQIGAKSGTAEIGTDRVPHAWFTGFLKNPEAPYAFIVFVEQGGGGNSVAGEIAAQVLRAAAGN